MTKANDRVVARMSIDKPGKMSAKERRDIAAWLRRHADHLMKHGKEYTEGRFTGRFTYVS